MLVMIKKKFYDAEGRVMHYVGDNSGDLKVFIPEGAKYNIGDVIKIEAISDSKFKINKSEKIENFRIEDFLPTIKRSIEDIMNELKSI
ncbi:MAG TPA: phosphohydrolase, partial [Clostridium sp.]|nr:phosphohydrolase [Clostridium sp.]